MSYPKPASFNPAGVRAIGSWPTAHPFDALEASAALFPDRPAVIDRGRTSAYAALHEASMMLAGYLQQHLEVRRGDRVLLLMQDSLASIVACFAILRCDAVAVVLPASSTADAVACCVTDSGCRVAITARPLLAAVMPSLDNGSLAGCVVEAASGTAEAGDRRLHDFCGSLAAGIAPMVLEHGESGAAVVVYTRQGKAQRVTLNGDSRTGAPVIRPATSGRALHVTPAPLAQEEGVRGMHDTVARGQTVVLCATR